jgi:hypothetical protein
MNLNKTMSGSKHRDFLVSQEVPTKLLRQLNKNIGIDYLSLYVLPVPKAT